MFAEHLPDSCPPTGARHPTGELFYRVVKTNPPTDIDFYSQYKKQPNRLFPDLCQAKALSIYQSVEECDTIRKATKEYRGGHIVSIRLTEESGLIHNYNTSSSTHHSWWLYQIYNPIPQCQYIR